MPLLRQVHQVEVVGEGPHQGLGLLGGKPLHPGQKRLSRRLVPLAAGLGEGPHLLHQGEEALPGEGPDGLPEEAAEEVHLGLKEGEGVLAHGSSQT